MRILAIGLAAACLSSASLPAVAAGTGISAKGVTKLLSEVPGQAELLSKVDALFEAELKAYDIPGAAVALLREGRVIHVKGYGEASPGKLAGGDTPFLVGSVSKSMTAVGLMLLVDEGLVDLGKPVLDYLPAFRMADPRYSSITVHDLLCHRSGLSTRLGQEFMAEPWSLDSAGVVARLGKEGLASPPGSRYEYSNMNYVLAGALIETVSGEPYASFMAERVFAPIGMATATAEQGKALDEGLAIGARGFLGWPLPGLVRYPSGLVPAGYLAASAKDLASYLAFLASGGLGAGGKRLLSEKAFREMTSIQTALGGDVGYGYGFQVSPEGIGHRGEVPGYLAEFVSLREGWSWAILLGRNDALGEFFLPSCLTRIELGMYGILYPGLAPSPPALHLGLYRLASAAVVLLALAVLVASAIGLARYGGGPKRGAGAACKGGAVRKAARLIGIVVFNLAMPIAVLVVVPMVARAPWKVVASGGLDLAAVCLVYSALALPLGAAWLWRLARSGREARTRREPR